MISKSSITWSSFILVLFSLPIGYSLITASLGSLSACLSFTNQETIIVGSLVAPDVRELCISNGKLAHILRDKEQSKTTLHSFFHGKLERLSSCDYNISSNSIAFGGFEAQIRIFDHERKQLSSICVSSRCIVFWSPGLINFAMASFQNCCEIYPFTESFIILGFERSSWNQSCAFRKDDLENLLAASG